MNKNETLEKIKAGTICIENGKLIGLGFYGKESIDLIALDDLMGNISPIELSDIFCDTVQRLGSLGLYLYKAGESVPDPSGALLCGVPDENALFYIHLVSKLFRA
ncbi:MAG: hypothetical protein WAO52_18925 [Prolixibacteraceae bacterium]